MNYNSIVSYKKINVLLPVILASAVIIGPLAMESNVFATTVTIPNGIHKGEGSNIAKQDIAQANNATTAALCTSGVITGAACNTTANQSTGQLQPNITSKCCNKPCNNGPQETCNTTANQGISQ